MIPLQPELSTELTNALSHWPRKNNSQTIIAVHTDFLLSYHLNAINYQSTLSSYLYIIDKKSI